MYSYINTACPGIDQFYDWPVQEYTYIPNTADMKNEDNHDMNECSSTQVFLQSLNLHETSHINYEQFHSLCENLFGLHEVQEHNWIVNEIFHTLNPKGDSITKEGEDWKKFLDWITATMNPVNVLLVVDVQNDFIDGSLALRNSSSGEDGADVVEPINNLIRKGHWDKVIFSLDYHPENHISFYENLHLRQLHPMSTKADAKPFDTVIFTEPHVEQKLWLKHCVENTWGAELHKDLLIPPHSEQVRKGQNPDKEAYSVFGECNGTESSEIQKILNDCKATNLYVCGLAYDVCVKSSCLDGLSLGYSVAVIDDCCRAVSLQDAEAAKKSIIEKGGLVTSSNEVLSLVNEKKCNLTMSYQHAKRRILIR